MNEMRRPKMAALLHPNRVQQAQLPQRAQLPQYQFEAARTLRGAGWSHYHIRKALGITESQVRCAVDPKSRAAYDRWAA